LPLAKNPVLQAEQVPAKSQAVHSAVEVLQAAHEVPKKPALQAEQVPAKSQAVHSGTEVLQAAHELPKKPAPHAVQVDPSVQVTQLAIELGQEVHVLALTQNPEEQAEHVAPSCEQAVQSPIKALQAAQELPANPALQLEHPA